MTTQKNITVNLTLASLLKFLAILAGLYFIFLIKDVVISIFIALILASAINPVVNRLEKRRIPRLIGVLAVYASLILLLSLIMATIVKPLATELQVVASFVPEIIDKLRLEDAQLPGLIPATELQKLLFQAAERLSQISINVFSVVEGIIGGLMATVAVVVISFYLVLEDEGVRNFIRAVTPTPYRKSTLNLWEKSQRRLGSWLRGQLLVMLAVGVLTFIGLSLLGMPFSMALALLMALFEIIPYAGPVIAAVPGIVVAFAFGGVWYALGILAVYFIVQELESYVLTPKIMQRTTQLNPIFIIIAIFAGAKLGGLLGVLLAIPVIIIVSELARDLFNISAYHPLPVKRQPRLKLWP